MAAEDEVRPAGVAGLEQAHEPVGARHVVVVDEGHQVGAVPQRRRDRPVAREGGAGRRLRLEGDREGQPGAREADEVGGRTPGTVVDHHEQQLAAGRPLGVLERGEQAPERERAVGRADADGDAPAGPCRDAQPRLAGLERARVAAGLAEVHQRPARATCRGLGR